MTPLYLPATGGLRSIDSSGFQSSQLAACSAAAGGSVTISASSGGRDGSGMAGTGYLFLPTVNGNSTVVPDRYQAGCRRDIAARSLRLALPKVPTNGQALHVFRHHVTDLWRRTLRRRSQKDRMTWERMTQLVTDWLPKPVILHPWPSDRFAVTHPLRSSLQAERGCGSRARLIRRR